jgi:uncharacterized protein YndB with AHSA1/START domain
MWKYEHSIETSASPKTVWDVYLDIDAWPKWNATMDTMDIDGAFETGATGVIMAKPMGGHPADPAPYKLLDVNAGESFTQEIEITDTVNMKSTSTITALPDGGSRIHQENIFVGEGSEQMGAELGDLLKQGLAADMESLKDLVESRA